VVLSNTGAPAYVDLDYVAITTGDGKAEYVLHVAFVETYWNC
jgi:hypothetical protein